MPMSEEEFAARAEAGLKKAEKPALFSLEGILALGTSAAGIIGALGLFTDPVSKGIGLLVAASAAIYLGHKRGKLKELLIGLAGDYIKNKSQ